MGAGDEGWTPAEVVGVRDGYDRWSEIYDGEDNPLVLLEELHLSHRMGTVAELDVADIGCGTGRRAIPMAAAGARVTALDFSEGMLAKARGKALAGSVRFQAHDLTRSWPLDAGGFDLAISCLVLDHVPDLRHFFSEVHRILRSDGRFVMSVIHPAMALRGVQARFPDPDSGRRIGLASCTHSIADYLNAAVRANLELEWAAEHSVDEQLAARSVRAVKHLGWPLLLLMKFTVRRP
jgi:SAM-dependent methyltransferase